MTEAELVTEIEGENLPAKATEAAPRLFHDHWSASDEAIATARQLLASATVMLANPNPVNLRSETMARLSSVMTLVGSL